MCLPDLFLRHAHEPKWSGLPAILAGNGRRFAELPGTPHVGWTDPAPSPWIPDAFIVHAHQKVEAFMGLEAAIRRDPFQPRQSAIVNRGVTRNTSTQVGRKFSASVLVAH